MCRFTSPLFRWLLLVGYLLLGAADSTEARSPLWLFKRSKEVAKNSQLLTEDNGPWMIFAASFAGEGAATDARRLAHELRSRYKLSAYLHKKNYDFTQSVAGKGYDMYGNRKRMRYSSGGSFNEIAVLVGDYVSLDDPRLQKHLRLIKYATPNSLSRSGQRNSTTLRFAGLRELQRRIVGDKEKRKRGPMAKAFATPNPILPREMFAPGGLDPFLVKLNKGRKNSLLDCPGKYTVQVASYRGYVVIDQQEIARLEQGKKFKSRLDQAGAKAEKLAALLRKRGAEAYVFHDRHESIVTIGSFAEIGRPLGNGKTDLLPAVAKIMETYAPVRKPMRGQNGVSLTGIQPRALSGYAFDIAPQPIEVPRRSIARDYAFAR